MEELERNLIDNILESEVKLGQACSPITFYYPESSLTELLDCSAGELPLKIVEFLENEKERLGNITIGELGEEKGRYRAKCVWAGISQVYKRILQEDDE